MLKDDKRLQDNIIFLLYHRTYREQETFNEEYVNSLKDKLVCISLGKDGSKYFYNDLTNTLPSIKVKPVDTTGAGDIFLGTFLTMIAKYGKSIDNLAYDDLLSYTNKACKLASLSTEKYGAINSIPDFN